MLGLNLINPDIVPTDGETAGVRYCNSDFVTNLARWAIVDLTISDKERLLAQGERILPKPTTNPNEPGANERYAAYQERAVWFGVTARTLSGLVGEVFATEPTVDGLEGTVLEAIQLDADGSGVTLEQQARETLRLSIAFGRAGLLTDYPKSGPTQSYADQLKGNLHPVILRIEPHNIINWREQLIGSKKKLTLVVIRETYKKSDDGFQVKYAPQWRVLKLVPGVNSLVPNRYIVQIWQLDEANKPVQIGEDIVPTKPNGSAFEEITFTFVGPQTNESKINNAPLYDMAMLNISHFRNSADYEEMAFFCGQVTPVFTGLDAKYIQQLGHKKPEDYKIYIGSRQAVLLPVGGDAKFLQAETNSMPMEAMLHKESQMRALGAKLVENVSTTKTATQDTRESSQDSSVLASCAVNVSAAFTKCLKWAAEFVNVPTDKVEYALSTSFTTSKMTYQDRMQLMKEWQGGGISYEEYRFKLRRDGIAYLDDKDAKEQIKQEQADELNTQVQHAADLAVATGPTDPNEGA